LHCASHAERAVRDSGIVGASPQLRLAMKLRFTALLASLAVVAGASLLAAPAAENWENHCAKCHGTDGKGQTKAGKKLNVKDYTDAKVQAEMKDADMIKATTDGILDKAGKEKMKAYKDELSAEEIKDLVAYVRKFKA
jgi:mono/diheme cytochrome c family protein